MGLPRAPWWCKGICSIDSLMSLELFILFGFSLQALAMPDALAGLCFNDIRVNDFDCHLYRLLGLAILGIGIYVLQTLLHGTHSAKRDCLRYSGFLMFLFAGELARAGFFSDLRVNQTFAIPLAITLIFGVLNISCVLVTKAEDTQELINSRQSSTPW